MVDKNIAASHLSYLDCGLYISKIAKIKIQEYKYVMNKKHLILLLIVCGVIGAILFFANTEKKDDAGSIFKCPEEMQNFDEYADNRAEVASLLYKKNPSLSTEEAKNIIMEMAIKKGCSNDVDYLKEYKQSINGEESELDLVSDDYFNNQKLLEYDSGLGFSFKYPDYTKVERVYEGNSWIVISPKDNENTKIIISIGDNSENLKAEEWFLGENSGFDPSEDIFFRTKIDGQNAVYTEGGTWLVVNTRDNKYRLSIAKLTTGDAKVMYKEMGIVLKTLRFK